MNIRHRYPNVEADLALIRDGGNDPGQLKAGSIHTDNSTGNVVFTYAGPGDLTYADLARELDEEGR